MRIAAQRAQRNAEIAAGEAESIAGSNPSSTAKPTNPSDKSASTAPLVQSSIPAVPVPNSKSPVTTQTSPANTVASDPSEAPTQTQPPQPRFILKSNLLQLNGAGSLVAYSGDNNSIGVYDVPSKSLVRKLFNSQLSPTCLAFDEDSLQLAVGSENGALKVFSLESVKGLDRYAQEQITRKDREPPLKAHTEAITAIAVRRQSQLVATGDISGEVRIWSVNSAKADKQADAKDVPNADNKLTTQPLISVSATKIANVAITILSFHDDGKDVLVGDASGKLSLRAIDNLAVPMEDFQGMNVPLVQAKISPNGKSLLALYDDSEHSVLVWTLGRRPGLTESEAPDRIFRNPENRIASACFTTDSQYVLIGDIDGLIRAWSLGDAREISGFQGHSGPVGDIAPNQEAGRFVSCGTDRVLCEWRFPMTLPRAGAAIPDGTLVGSNSLQSVTAPQESLSKEDVRIAAAREALLSRNANDEQTGEILELLSSDAKAVAEAKSSNSRLRALESDPKSSLTDIYQARLKNSKLRRQLLSDESVATVRYENAMMEAQTNFRFDSLENSRPVKLRFAKRFLYAARPSLAKEQTNADEPSKDVGDNGALLSWEYRVTQLPSREWSVDEINVREIFSLPESGGAIAVPSMMLFSQNDGSSLQLPTASSWEISRPLIGRSQLLAVGSAGADRTESEILQVYDVAKLRGENIQPVSHYTSYEGVVTAMAFAHLSSRIAFCVRERTVHRLYIAEADRLEKTMTLIQEYPHKKPWIAVGTGQGVPGVTSLAFSPDDRMLVGHGQYEEELYRLSAWKLSGESTNSLTAIEKFKRENKQRPLIAERNSRPLRFAERPDGEVLIAEVENRFVIWNLTSGDFTEIPFLPMQSGLPERELSEDGRWLIMGDDRGNAYIWDVQTGERFSVAHAAEMMQVPSSTIDLGKASKNKSKGIELPVHTGPVVGVALSPSGLHGNFPEFAATIGEENRIIVWDLIPVLGNRSPVLSKATKRTAIR